MAQEETFMINKKTALILFAVVLILCAFTAFVFVWDGPDKQGEDENIQNESIVVFEGNKDELMSIKVSMPHDVYFISKYGDGWTIDGVDTELIVPYTVDSLAFNVSNVVAKSIVEENPSDLEKYGLEVPSYVITATYKNDKKSFFLGDKTSLGDGYYLADETRDTVYVVNTSVFSSFFKEKSEYMDTSLLKIDANKLNKIHIKNNKVSIKLNSLENPQVIDGYTIADWEMTEPYKLTIDSSQLSEAIITKIAAITTDALVSDKGDLSTYGLSNPYATVTLWDSDGSSQTLGVSQIKNGKCYVSTSGSKLIYSVDSSSIDFVDIDPFKLVNKFVNIVFVDETEKIVVKNNNDEYTLSVSGNDKKIYMYNGVAVEEEKFKVELYQPVIGLVCSSFCLDAVYKTPSITIEYYMADKSFSKVEFVEYDDRNFAVFKDGSCIFKILKKDVNSMLDSLKNFK